MTTALSLILLLLQILFHIESAVWAVDGLLEPWFDTTVVENMATGKFSDNITLFEMAKTDCALFFSLANFHLLDLFDFTFLKS